MGTAIIEDQAHITVRCWRGMRQSLTNDGFYMCEVNKVLPLFMLHIVLVYIILYYIVSCSFIVVYNMCSFGETT